MEAQRREWTTFVWGSQEDSTGKVRHLSCTSRGFFRSNRWESFQKNLRRIKPWEQSGLRGLSWVFLTGGPYSSHFVTECQAFPLLFLIYCPVNSSWWATTTFVCSDARYCSWANNSALYCLAPLVVAAHNPLLSPSQKQPPLCVSVSFIEQVSQDQTGGLLSDALWDPTEILPHQSQLVTRNGGCF